MFTTSHKHPYGVLPSGNSYFCNPAIAHVRSYGLGYLACFSDEAIIDTLSYLDFKTLCNVSLCSRALYVFSNHFELWRDLMLRQWNGGNIDFNTTWRDTFALTYIKLKNINSRSSIQMLKPIKVDGIFSNLLYRSWVCSTFDFDVACPGFSSNFDIRTVSKSENISVQEFYEQFELTNTPVILRGAVVSEWPTFAKWTREYLIRNCGTSMKFRATSPTAPLGAEFTIEQYFKYADQAVEEAPLYLFERDFMSGPAKLGDDWQVPKFFSISESAKELNHYTDLFRVFGDSRRPDYRWLVLGPKRSGSLFHIDPNSTHAWNCCITGRKKWIFYPPNNPPPGVVSSADGADVIVPISTGEWLLTFWKFHMKERNNPDLSKRPLEGTTEPGDVIFVPCGYWHMVVNLEDCIALTQNYVSTSNLATCLHFLREKEDQISGVRDREGLAVRPEEMYDELVAKLPQIIPQSVLDEAIARSYRLSTPKPPIDQNQFNLNRLRCLPNKNQKDKDTCNESVTSTETKSSEIFKASDEESKSFCFNF